MVFVVAAIVVLGACAGRPYAPIDVTANDFDLTPLVGKWSGDYASTETGRQGSITFTLEPGSGNAYGDVVMIPKTSQALTRREEGQTSPAATLAAVRQVLTIHFVRKQGYEVIGTLDPYTDPDCGCEVTTTFDGKFLDGKTIEGTYKTIATHVKEIHSGGHWKVTRVQRF